MDLKTNKEKMFCWTNLNLQPFRFTYNFFKQRVLLINNTQAQSPIYIQILKITFLENSLLVIVDAIDLKTIQNISEKYLVFRAIPTPPFTTKNWVWKQVFPMILMLVEFSGVSIFVKISVPWFGTFLSTSSWLMTMVPYYHSSVKFHICLND